jgi:peptidoglycan/xylan/chitin deacetylase (PgdA/CDA1 family)
MSVPVILGYHAVSDRWRSPLAVSRSGLSEQLQFFRRRGYTGLTLAAAESLRRAGALPRKSLVITFDDGFASVLLALPLLERHGWPATVFVVTDFASSGRPLEWHGLDGHHAPENERIPLTWDQLRGLYEREWEVGSHTASHPLLTRLAHARALHEMAHSRHIIADEIGRCTTLAYPFGVADDDVAAIARSVGYDAACTLRGTQRHDQPMMRPRSRLDSTHRGFRLQVGASSLNRRLRSSRAAQIASTARGRRGWFPRDGAY